MRLGPVRPARVRGAGHAYRQQAQQRRNVLLLQPGPRSGRIPTATRASLPRPAPSPAAPGCPLDTPGEAEAFLREPAHYPLFAKPVDGKYSLAVLNAERVDQDADRVILRGQGRRPVAEVARQLLAWEGGFVIQRRLAPDAGLCGMFGPALWSLRLVVLLTPAGSVIHWAVAKIATGTNPADNFWRPGNMRGAVNLLTGAVERVVRGTGAGMTGEDAHPDTGQPLVGTRIPDWAGVQDLAKAAAQVLPGLRTQSWDVALTDRGPVLLEVNFGGNLNLAQLAHGTGALDDAYRGHLRSCGYPIRFAWPGKVRAGRLLGRGPPGAGPPRSPCPHCGRGDEDAGPATRTRRNGVPHPVPRRKGAAARGPRRAPNARARRDTPRRPGPARRATAPGEG